MMLSVVAFGFMGGGYRSDSTAKIESEVIMCIQSHGLGWCASFRGIGESPKYVCIEFLRTNKDTHLLTQLGVAFSHKYVAKCT